MLSVGPGRWGDHAKEDLDARPMQAIHNAVHLAPADVALAPLKVAPAYLLLDPTKAHGLGVMNDRTQVVVDQVGLEAIAKFAAQAGH